MKKVLLFALLPTAALAQQAQPPQSMVEQVAAIHANIEINLAKQLDAANAKIKELEAQIAKAKTDAKPKP